MVSDGTIYLPEASIEQLVDELARRSRSVVVGMEREDRDGSEGVLVFYRGGEVSAVGLVEIIRQRLLCDFDCTEPEET